MAASGVPVESHSPGTRPAFLPPPLHTFLWEPSEMNTRFHYLFALLAVFGWAIGATAETKLINPIARSFRPPQPQVSPATFQQGDSPAGVGEQPSPTPAADVPAATDPATPAPAATDCAAATAEPAADTAEVQPAIPPGAGPGAGPDAGR